MAALFPSRGFRRTRERVSGLYFAFGVDDLSTTIATGQSLALTRASGRTVFDAAGRLTTLAHSAWPWSMVYNSTEAVWEPTLDVRPLTTNLCLQSENFGTTWAAIGVPTRTAAAASCGDLALDLLGDNSAAVLQGYSQVSTYTGAAVKAVSLFVKQGTSTSAVIRLRDTTGAANRLLATLTWSAGAPSLAMTTGTYIGAIACAKGVYRLQFQTTSVTPGNVNQLEVYPATTSALAIANTGDLYVGGVQCENANTPGPYVKTAAATASSSLDVVTASIAIPIADFSVYIRLARPWWAGLTTGWAGNVAIFGQAATASNSVWQLFIDPINQLIQSSLSTGGAGVAAGAAIPATSFIDVCANFKNLTTGPQTRIDVGAGPTVYGSIGGIVSSWNSNTTAIGSEPGASSLGIGIRRAIIAPGLLTLAQMRGLNI